MSHGRGANSVNSSPVIVPRWSSLEIRPADKIVLLGDSITSATWKWWAQWETTINAVLTAAGKTLPTYVNSGVGGDYISNMYARLAADVIAHAPNVLFIQGGVNDARNAVAPATSATNLASIIDDTRASFPNVRIVVVGPWADGMAIITATTPTPNPNDAAIDATNAAMRAVAVTKGVAWVDWRQWFKTVTTQTEANTLSGDGVHPTSPVGTGWLSNKVLNQTIVRTNVAS